MMIIVIVEHFLDQEGKLYFPSWLMKARKELKKWQGFKRIELLKKKNEISSLLYMEFDSKEELRLWAQSQEHDQLLKLLLPFRLKKQYSEIYEFEK